MASGPATIASAGISGVSNFAGGKAQADAEKQAANLQNQYNNRALDFTQQAYSDLTKRLQPYQNAGTSATDVMATLLGRSPYIASLRGPGGMAPISTVSRQVTLKAPNGTTKVFAANDPRIAAAQQAGATVL